jgi:hypothetical protein
LQLSPRPSIQLLWAMRPRVGASGTGWVRRRRRAVARLRALPAGHVQECYWELGLDVFALSCGVLLRCGAAAVRSNLALPPWPTTDRRKSRPWGLPAVRGMPLRQVQTNCWSMVQLLSAAIALRPRHVFGRLLFCERRSLPTLPTWHLQGLHRFLAFSVQPVPRWV